MKALPEYLLVFSRLGVGSLVFLGHHLPLPVLDLPEGLRRDPDGQPFNCELKLFDPYFEGLDYKEHEEEEDIWG